MVRTMTKDNTVVNIKGNKHSEINVSIGQLDELSLDSISRNYNKFEMIESNFSERLEFTKYVLTNKLLPEPLRSDFEIVPNYTDGKIEFEIQAITPDAYKKFPLNISYTMKFKSTEEAQKFRKTGMQELLNKSKELQKPVEVPNIISAKEYIGEYENPVGYIKKYGCEGLKLYISPLELPKTRKYRIGIYNSNMNFELETNLCIKEQHKNKIVLTNKNEENETFDVKITFDNIKKIENTKSIDFKFNINLSLREKCSSSCKLNKEMIKYQFLIKDQHSHLQFYDIEDGTNILTIGNCGNNIYKKSDYEKFNRLIELIDKAICISKIQGIDMDYDLELLAKNEVLINLLYNEIFGKDYIINQKAVFNVSVLKSDKVDKISKQGKAFNADFKLNYIRFFGKKIILKSNKLKLLNCLILDVKEEKEQYNLKVEFSGIIFTLL